MNGVRNSAAYELLQRQEAKALIAHRFVRGDSLAKIGADYGYKTGYMIRSALADFIREFVPEYFDHCNSLKIGARMALECWANA